MINTEIDPQATEPGDPEAPPVGLTWGLKRSFIRYIGSLPDGGHALGDGASLSHGSFFTFAPAPGSTFDPLTLSGTLKFAGQLRLTGHHNMLYVLLADPWIEFAGGEAILTVLDATSWPDRTKRIRLAELSPGAHELFSDGSLIFPAMGVRLADTGVEVFGGNYPAAEEMDPLFVLSPPPAAPRAGSNS